ncbi:gallate 1-beta-glucosyltransferase [Zea mays]|jgi:gallate 1-beta-glucosyltransferase|uniref:Glycosyltransferase n=1 Tax=Zea mays TaxID=4577 RepID=A0A1D6LW97_MAIZE|nr:gallate 1-beta-glucosyltransferase [Zea mays]AQK83517.1 UDP-glycosyltransferase 84A1 [Zea mays]|eukprot:XP_008649287.1 gallate 1-beta-glucosyltransferase [Zea mays]
MAEEVTPHNIHILLICYPSQGHINPMLRLAKRIAAKGILVTCSSSSVVRDDLAAASGVSAGGDGVPFGAGRLRFDFLDDPFDGTLLDLEDFLRHLETAGRLALADLLRRQAEAGRPVSCVIGNPFLPWVTDVAADAGIPSAVLWVQSCAVFSVYYHFVHGLAEFPREDDLEARFMLPGLPTLSVADVPSFLHASHPYKVLGDTIQDQFRNMGKASWVFVNSFAELERDVIAALPSVRPRPPQLIPVGPLVELGDQDDAPVRGDLIKAADDCIGWLDAQAPRSVVYASVGSIVTLSTEVIAEMAYGLASTGRPFLWVVRPDTRPLLPEGFLDAAVAGRGMVVPWSPQDRVLAHASTACFLTHCGWNSTLETVAAGVPVLAFPQWGDQCTDAKFLVDELRMGVLLRAPLRREGVREAVDAATTGAEADAMFANAMFWSAAARAALTPGGSSDRNVQAFIDEVSRQARQRTS